MLSCVVCIFLLQVGVTQFSHSNFERTLHHFRMTYARETKCTSTLQAANNHVRKVHILRLTTRFKSAILGYTTRMHLQEYSGGSGHPFASSPTLSGNTPEDDDAHTDDIRHSHVYTIHFNINIPMHAHRFSSCIPSDFASRRISNVEDNKDTRQVTPCSAFATTHGMPRENASRRQDFDCAHQLDDKTWGRW